MLAPYNSFKWMGCVICFVAMVGVAPIYFPMWGGLICGPKKGYTEEDYYFSEYTPAEREAGHHLASSKFVSSLPSACDTLPLTAGDNSDNSATSPPSPCLQCSPFEAERFCLK